MNFLFTATVEFEQNTFSQCHFYQLCSLSSHSHTHTHTHTHTYTHTHTHRHTYEHILPSYLSLPPSFFSQFSSSFFISAFATTVFCQYSSPIHGYFFPFLFLPLFSPLLSLPLLTPLHSTFPVLRLIHIFPSKHFLFPHLKLNLHLFYYLHII